MEQPAEQITIDELARIAHVSVRNVRAYIERGLLPRPRIVGRTGYYDRSHLERMQTIARLQQAGFSLSSIVTILETWERGGSLGQIVGHNSEDMLSAPASPLVPLTKFQPPIARAEIVVRQRCLDMLGSHCGRPHVLISAPAGSGKSTLAAQLRDATPGHGVWVSLEPRDDELGQFWSTVMTGIRLAVPGFGATVMPVLTGGGELNRVLVAMVNEITALRGALTLVLDDLHSVRMPEVLETLEWLLGHSPANLRIVMSTRVDPALPVSVMVMRGDLLTLRDEQLRFDSQETSELLGERLGLELPQEQIELLSETTDGWAAGVYLAAISIRAGASAVGTVAGLADGDQRLQEYFAREVLAPLNDRQLAFLEGVSILDRFTAELCDDVLARADSREVLAGLEATNMFVIRLDPAGHWWRLHHLFASVLRARLAGNGRAVAARHTRAGRWHERNGNPADAIDQFIQAEAFPDAIRVLAATYPLFMNISRRGAIIERWLSAIPEEVADASASLNVAMAGVAGLNGDEPRMKEWLAKARRFPPDQVLPDGGTVASNCDLMSACFHFGDLEPSLAAARSAYAAFPTDAMWQPMAGAALALLAYWVDGPTDEILSVADDVISNPHSKHQPIALAGVWALKGAVLAEQGHPDALAIARVAAQLRTAALIDGVPQAANIWASTARVHLLLDDLEAAATNSQAGYDAVSAIPPECDAIGAVTPALIGLAHARALQGRDAEASDLTDEAERRLRLYRSPGRLPAMLRDVNRGPKNR